MSCYQIFCVRDSWHKVCVMQSLWIRKVSGFTADMRRHFITIKLHYALRYPVDSELQVVEHSWWKIHSVLSEGSRKSYSFLDRLHTFRWHCPFTYCLATKKMLHKTHPSKSELSYGWSSKLVIQGLQDYGPFLRSTFPHICQDDTRREITSCMMHACPWVGHINKGFR